MCLSVIGIAAAQAIPLPCSSISCLHLGAPAPSIGARVPVALVIGGVLLGMKPISPVRPRQRDQNGSPRSAAALFDAIYSHFSNRLASDKATELGDEATVVADGEGPVASDDGSHIRSSKTVRRIRARRRKGRR
jgi:hypothetical protein